MAYADQQMSGNRIVGLIVAAIVHIALGYALVTGLAYEAVKKAVERVTTVDIEEPPPPEEEPPPPPEQPDRPPPPVAPPPPINIAPAPPQIQTQPTIPPPAPPVLRVPPPAPAAPPAPSKARGASPDNQGRWAARIQGDYPSRALRAEEQGVVRMTITVGPDGKVQACQVTGSSGSSTLDDAACRGMERYARYKPALNAGGDPISDTLTQSIRYVLPE